MENVGPDTTSQDEPKPVVLLIDDCADIHRLLQARLRSESLELVAAFNGADGIELARQLRPAVIILDIHMEPMDGYEVLRHLKDDSALHDIPVIVLSGRTGSDDKLTAFDLGASDYVTKPFNLPELKARVRAAVKFSSLLQMLAQRAQVDGLSGLWNRSRFDVQWPIEYARAVRYGHALSLAMVDIDHFKSINDTYGHPAGDTVIQTLARLMAKEVRQADIVCRYGGEEFAIIMPETSPKQASELCERIRARFEQLRWPKHPERLVTSSTGIAGMSVAASVDPLRWIEEADQSLYRAKRSGRNRIVVMDLGGLTTPRLAEAG
jgi:diguanylate cyclase (GGDEF)-like protein